ncbi:MAG TPA: hypothetical protein VJV03_12565 [Pyrinomonadaceae bacterium]|nr:hypothetical protein [Pyrinomonadaceae bacterium]
MTRNRRFRFLLSIGILLPLLGLATLQAQTKERFVVDTGVIALPSNHVLRVTGATASVNETMTVAFRRLRYIEGTCNSAGVCVNEVVADDSSGPVAIAPGEAASYSASGTPAAPSVRVMLLSNNRDIRVTAQIINQTTGEIVAIWVPQGSPIVATKP